MKLISIEAWMKVLRIIPEFRILRLTFHRKLYSAGNNSFSDLVSVYLKVFAITLGVFDKEAYSKF